MIYSVGKNSNFMFAGLTKFVGILLGGILSIISNFLVVYSSNYIENSLKISVSSLLLASIISLLFSVFLYVGTVNLGYSNKYQPTQGLQNISKMILGLVILDGLLTLSMLFIWIEIITDIYWDIFSNIFIITFSILTIIYGIMLFVTCFFIWKFIKKQRESVLQKLVAIIVLLYTITASLGFIFEGLYYIGFFEPYYSIIRNIRNLFGYVSAPLSIVLAFLLIYLALKLNQHPSDIIVPQGIEQHKPETQICKSCGQSISKSEQFCTTCGTKVEK